MSEVQGTHPDCELPHQAADRGALASGEVDDDSPQGELAVEVLSAAGRQRIARVVRGVLGAVDQAVVEDTTQDVLLRAYERAGQFRGDSKPATWLHVMASRTATNAGVRITLERKRIPGSLDYRYSDLALTLRDKQSYHEPERMALARVALREAMTAMDTVISRG